MEIVAAVERAGFPVEEVITSGTPAFPCAATFAPFAGAGFIHRASPGTVVYSDATSLIQLPEKFGYRAAALVVSTVVSHPKANVATCDGGHKAVSADAGLPTCVVAGRPHLHPLKPSEEHLPIEVREGGPRPAIGEALYLIPRHVCPSVNNFDDALLIRDGGVIGVERVTARGHETPLKAATAIS
jgi:D-serine deaminase-like pyridoxal phosphate-dependent protein